jgi:hypothetical protein
MSRFTLRLLGGGATALAGLTLTLLIMLVACEQPVAASACCQTCEANENACYASCDNGPAEARDDCYASCYHQLYEVPSACWLHCYYCGGGGGSNSSCYHCNSYYLCDSNYCVYLYTECASGGTGLPQDGSACTSW